MTQLTTVSNEFRMLGTYRAKTYLMIAIENINTIPIDMTAVSGLVIAISPGTNCSYFAQSADVTRRIYVLSVNRNGGYVYLPYGGQIQYTALDGGEYTLYTEEKRTIDEAVDVIDTINIPRCDITLDYETPPKATHYMIQSNNNVSLELSYVDSAGISRIVSANIWYPITTITKIGVRTPNTELIFKVAVPRENNQHDKFTHC